jgi:hypothetical protein
VNKADATQNGHGHGVFILATSSKEKKGGYFHYKDRVGVPLGYIPKINI